MGFFQTIKRWFAMILRTKAKEEFGAVPVSSAEMDRVIQECVRAYQGNPDWTEKQIGNQTINDGIKTINFAKSICSEVARLAALGIGIHIDGSARAEWLQEQIDNIYFKLREWVEYGCAFGTIILKPNGSGVEMYTPGNFTVTDTQNGKITGAVFLDTKQGESEKTYYTRLEYHRFLPDGLYAITNRCFIGSAANDTKRRVDIQETPWSDLAEEAYVQNMNGRTLFSVLRTPQANNVDIESPLSLPVFYEALEELRDLDIAYSRNAEEIDDSRRTVLLDSDTLVESGTSVKRTSAVFERRREELKLPKYVRNVTGNGTETLYKEINPTLNTEERVKGINNLLSQIGYKVGFSNGHFVFNETTGIQTATGVEAAQQRTIQFIKDVRDKLESCMDDLIYALDVFASLYALAPNGKYEVTYDFGDITYSFEEDKANWKYYVTQGWVPKWKYLAKFEGMTEEEAKAIVEEAQAKTPSLFGSEE